MNLKFSKQLQILDFIQDSLLFDFLNNLSQQTSTCTPLTPAGQRPSKGSRRL
jgi:hypothetical protein